MFKILYLLLLCVGLFADERTVYQNLENGDFLRIERIEIERYPNNQSLADAHVYFSYKFEKTQRVFFSFANKKYAERDEWGRGPTLPFDLSGGAEEQVASAQILNPEYAGLRFQARVGSKEDVRSTTVAGLSGRFSGVQDELVMYHNMRTEPFLYVHPTSEYYKVVEENGVLVRVGKVRKAGEPWNTAGVFTFK